MNADFCRLPVGHFVVLPTFQCNARCAHCQHACGPDVRETMPIDLFDTTLRQAIEVGYRTLCLSGGEVFLVPDHLQRAARLCREAGCQLVVQTNGFWGRDRDRAKALLEQCRGITQMGFSVDATHLQEVPLDSVLGAISETVDAGITNVSISVSYQKEAEFAAMKRGFQGYNPRIEVVGWPIMPIGRAVLHPELTAETPSYEWGVLQRSCGAQMQFSPIVHPNGCVHGCYRSVMALRENDPLVLGDVRERRLGEMLTSVSNRLLMFVTCFGGGSLGRLLEDSPYSHLLRAQYHATCHFCYAVLSNRDVAGYLESLLNDPAFDRRLEAGLEDAARKHPRQEDETRETILVCNGSRCAAGSRNYPIIHYLLNRLTDERLLTRVKVEVVDCLHACDKGPNLYLKEEQRLLSGVAEADIDALILDLQRNLSQGSDALHVENPVLATTPV